MKFDRYSRRHLQELCAARSFPPPRIRFPREWRSAHRSTGWTWHISKIFFGIQDSDDAVNFDGVVPDFERFGRERVFFRFSKKAGRDIFHFIWDRQSVPG